MLAKIATIGNPVDKDLFDRVVDGFEYDIVNNINDIKNYKVFYFHPEQDESSENLIKAAMFYKNTTCLGNAWFSSFNPATYIENGKTGYYSNNVDEIRWVIRKLLEKTAD